MPNGPDTVQISPDDPRYDALQEFFGSYFHQDWKDFSADGTFEAVVRQYARETGSEIVELACQGLDELLASRLDDPSLRDVVLRKLHGDIVRPNYRDWLRIVRDLLREHLAKSKG